MLNNTLKVYRYKNESKRGIMPKAKVDYYNQIDIGIFIYFLDLCLQHNNLIYERINHLENKNDNEYYLNATYTIKIEE